MSKEKTLAASKCDSHRHTRTWYQGTGKRSLTGIAMSARTTSSTVGKCLTLVTLCLRSGEMCVCGCSVRADHGLVTIMGMRSDLRIPILYTNGRSPFGN